ncbi:MAG: V-type ATPase subunit [Candidatus Aminicenantes bacterium]|nr:V-type ATPase subunit [Candidatus Aminicenantes bacterium]
MKNRSRLDYAYAVGRIRALEKGLISKSDFWEAVEEKNLISALKVLFDAGAYTEGLVEAQNSRDLDEYLAQEETEVLQMVKKLFSDEKLYSLVAEKKSPEELFTLAKASGLPFLIDYFRHSIDLGNLKIFSRVKYLGLGKEILTKNIMAGGYVSGSMLLDSLDLNWSEVGDKLRATPYFDLWTQGTDTLAEEETFVALERGSEDFIMNFLKRAKYIVFGPEPVFAFAVAKRREIRLIRLVGIGKFNGIPDGILKKRIGETYV